jgi:ATP-binding cassette subfamily F protein 3
MLRINDLSKSYGAELLFEHATLTMSPGQRLGLIGRNGHGKTTLFRLIVGEEEPDEGTIEFPRHYRVGYVEQHLTFESPTVLGVACEGLSAEQEYESYRAEEILFGLGFSKDDLARAPEELSGGFQVRLHLARTLVAAPNLLLLDEPTNYLDIVSVRWITRFLRAWKGELMLISHDREFMDAVSTHTAMIHRHAIRTMPGPTEKICAQIALDEEVYEKTRLNEERRREELLTFITRFKAKNTKAAAARSKMKMIEKMPLRDKLGRIADLDFRFHYQPFPAKTMLEARELSFAYDPQVPLIENFSMHVGAEDRIAVIGKNGKGKTTLLRLLAGDLEPQAGSLRRHSGASVGYFGQTNIERLQPKATVEEEIGAANAELGRSMVRGICGTMMFGGDKAEKKISVLSGGEKSRVLLGKLLAAPANLLLLDEPTNHLDMQAVEALTESIDEFPGAVVVVTHDEMILRNVATKLVLFQGGQVRVFDGGYDEFLEKVGWEDEADLQRAARPAAEEASAPSRRDVKRARAQIIQERSQVLRPLKQRIDSDETHICELEEELRQTNEELVAASYAQEGERCAALSRTSKKMQARIEELFADLESATLDYERFTAQFDTRMAALDKGDG